MSKAIMAVQTFSQGPNGLVFISRGIQCHRKAMNLHHQCSSGVEVLVVMEKNWECRQYLCLIHLVWCSSSANFCHCSMLRFMLLLRKAVMLSIFPISCHHCRSTAKCGILRHHFCESLLKTRVSFATVLLSTMQNSARFLLACSYVWA